MEPRRETLQPHIDRFCIPDLTFPTSPSRPNAIPVFNFPQQTFGFRPQRYVPRTHVHPLPNSYTTFSTRTRIIRPSLSNYLANPTLKYTSVECQYCSNTFEPEHISDHLKICEMSKVNCERCGLRLHVENYDIHHEECQLNIRFLMRPGLTVRRGDVMDDDAFDTDEMTESRGLFINDSEMTYERLLQLDENVEKKGMTPEQMKEFQVQLYVKSLDGPGSCTVCMEDYETGEYVRLLSCKHKYHKECVDKWLDSHITCPICKKYLR